MALLLFQLNPGPGNGRALDCGAGIGRITKHLLQRHFTTIDLVEQNPKFLDQAKTYLGQENKHLGQLFYKGLQVHYNGLL